jgi:hypothetical protein
MITIKERNIGVKIHWAEVKLCLVRASQCNFYSVVCLQECTNLTPRFSWTHREKWELIDGKPDFMSFERIIHRWRAAWQHLRSWHSTKWIVYCPFLYVYPESSSPSSQELPLDNIMSEISGYHMVILKCQTLIYDDVKSGTNVSKFRRYHDTMKRR